MWETNVKSHMGKETWSGTSYNCFDEKNWRKLFFNRLGDQITLNSFYGICLHHSSALLINNKQSNNTVLLKVRLKKRRYI